LRKVLLSRALGLWDSNPGQNRSQAAGAWIPYRPVLGCGGHFHRFCGRDHEVVGHRGASPLVATFSRVASARPEDSILYCHGRFLGPIVYNGMRRPDNVTLSRRGYDMSTEQAPPFLVDAVRASASKMQGMNAALDARAKELDALKGQLDSDRQALEKRAGRLEAERRTIEGEREEVGVAGASVDQDLGA